jgi:hypothetical protein
MKREKLALCQKDCWRNIAIALIDKIVREIVTLVGAKTHRQQRSGKTTIGLEESKLNTTNWQPDPVQG